MLQTFKVQSSFCLAMIIFVIYIVVVIEICLLNFSIFLKILSCLLCLFVFCVDWHRYVMLHASKSIKEFYVDDNVWVLFNCDWEKIRARLIGSILITNHLIVLKFETEFGRRVFVNLFSDAMSPNDYRTLKVQLFINKYLYLS